MSSITAPSLTPFQRAVLRRFVQGISANPSSELRLFAYLAIFLVLETLDVTPAQIDSVLGVGVTTLLNSLVDEGAASALIHVPVFGTVTPDGRIAYTDQAQRWLQEHDHAHQG